MTRTDYATHPNFQLENPYHGEYGPAIGRLNAAFQPDTDKDQLLREAHGILARYTPAQCREVFGLGTDFSLAKEFYYDVVCANAGAVARILEQRGQVAEARQFLLDLYGSIAAAGFTRDKDFFMNRLDSRTFMPMRRHLDRDYLKAIGYRHLNNILLCAGDCQTMLLSEKTRHALPLKGIDIAAYQHGIGSLITSPLEALFKPAGYFFFVNAAANQGLFPNDPAQRRLAGLEEMRKLVAWLQQKQPRLCVFVTHVFFGVDNAVTYNKVPREVAMDAVGPYSDEVAAILGTAPNARLINFRECCPFSPGTEPFRDIPTHPNLLHFRFDIMDALAARVAEALRPL